MRYTWTDKQGLTAHPDVQATHPLSIRFHEILKELGDTHNKKGADYGRETDPYANVRAGEDFGIRAWVTALSRGNDKMRRLQKYAKDGVLANEGAFDSLRDLAVYAIIAHVLLEEELANRGEQTMFNVQGGEVQRPI